MLKSFTPFLIQGVGVSIIDSLMIKTAFISIWLFLFTNGLVFGQAPSHPEAGLPFIQNFHPQITGGMAQNWQIIQDTLGMVYSANGSGILQYDGQTWRIIPAPNRGSIRSLALGKDGTVYFGARSDFGYLTADSSGTLRSVSLASRLKPSDHDFDRIRDILATNSGVYFVSQKKLFRWADNRLQVWPAPVPFLRGFLADDVVYLLLKDTGLFKLHNDSLHLLQNGAFFKDKLVYAITTVPKGRNPHSPDAHAILIATHTSGLYLYDGRSLKPFQTEVNDFLQESRIFHVAKLPEGNYAIATLKSGVILIDQAGNFLSQIDKRAGLLSTDVKNIHIDRDGGMWLGLQTGIARVEYGSPLSFFNEQAGLIGSIGSLVRHQGTLYASSSQGVLYLASSSARVKTDTPHEFHAPASRFKAVSGIKASCWSLLSVDQWLLAATEDGVYQIKKDRGRLIPPLQNKKLFALAMARSRYHANRAFAGLIDGVAILERTGDTWSHRGEIANTGRRVYNLIEMSPTELWLETRSDVIIRVQFKGKQLQNPVLKYYGPSAGLPAGQEIFLVNSGSDFLAYASSQMYRFDEKKDQFVPDTTYWFSFKEGYLYLSFLINGERGRTWNEFNGRIMRVALRDGPDAYHWLRDPFVKTQSGLIWSFYRDADGTIWFGGDDILYRYAPPAKQTTPHPFPALIRRVTTINSDSTIFGGTLPPKGLTIPAITYRDNALRFECTAISYDSPEANRFQYFLEGFDRGWSRWSTEAKKDYTNLPEGDYVFRVRARNVYGHDSREAVFAFTVLPPWYRTWWAYGLYVLFAGLLLYSIRHYELNRIRLKDQLKMNQFEAKTLKELDQMRSNFFANVSHEFRTPLTLIHGQIESLRTEIGDQRQTKKLDMAMRHARRLQQLINQLLDVAKMEAGKMPVRAQRADIVPFLRKLFASFESLAKQKRLGTRFYAQHERIDVYYEAEKLEKIFINLVANAFKFTPEGGDVSVSVRAPIIEEKKEWVEIEIRDSGIGIAEDHLPHIFDRFYQVESGDTRQYEGTGIGLALAKELVELHCGEIRVTSKIGLGTVFKVRLPLGREHFSDDQLVGAMIAEANPPAELAGESPSPAELVPVREKDTPHRRIILIVEDHPDMRQYIRENLQEAYTLAEAVDGEQGFEMAKDLIPDLIISDVMMPNVDGYDLARQIRAHELTSHIPIIMLTAKAAEDEKLEGLETGVDAYLTKPFSIRELQVRVRKLIELRRQLLQTQKQPLKITASEIVVTPVDERFLKRLQKIVEENLEDEAFQVSELCLKIGVGERQLYRKLHALLGCTPAAYIRQIRLDRAKQLLEKGAGTVSEITFMVGYANTSAFARAFREAFGKAPSAFLKKR